MVTNTIQPIAENHDCISACVAVVNILGVEEPFDIKQDRNVWNWNGKSLSFCCMTKKENKKEKYYLSSFLFLFLLVIVPFILGWGAIYILFHSFLTKIPVKLFPLYICIGALLEIIIKMLSLCSGCNITFYALSYNIYTTLLLYVYIVYCVGAVDERHYNIIYFRELENEIIFHVWNGCVWEQCTMYITITIITSISSLPIPFHHLSHNNKITIREINHKMMYEKCAVVCISEHKALLSSFYYIMV